MTIKTLLSSHIRTAMTEVGIPEDLKPLVAPSKNPQFGDYQANCAMGAAKAMGTKPRDLAQNIVDALKLEAIADKVDIAGPGFINIHLNRQWLADQLSYASNHERLNVPIKQTPKTVIIDYSGPNLAKEMHVGHLRSTIIGDCIARVLEFTGDTIIRQNHVGDWGTQFGMLIAELELHLSGGEQAELALKDLETFYQQSKKHFDDDENFANTARDYVVKLQGGDTQVNGLWQNFRDISLKHSEEVYERLNVTLLPEHVRGESAYNNMLAPTVKKLKDLDLAVEDAGAQVVFLQELADKEGNPSPVIVQKNDGGFLYATTDLAAIQYRSQTLKGNRILYFMDDRQSLHMKQVFTIARKAQLVNEPIDLEHLAFGKMLGKDKKPFKTRSGGTVKLVELLDESCERAMKVVQDKSEFNQQELEGIANKVGIGAVKYADLSKTRTNDYVFDWESMLSFEGNTGPYLQYAYTRVASLFDKAGLNMDGHSASIELAQEQEHALALKLLRFPETIEQVAEESYPHILCTYLFEVASLYMSFYEACPILKDDIEEATKNSRLQLCKATARTLKTGLDLLGIEVMAKM